MIIIIIIIITASKLLILLHRSVRGDFVAARSCCDYFKEIVDENRDYKNEGLMS